MTAVTEMCECVVTGCNSLSAGDISFHSFPNDKNLRKQWVNAVNRKDWCPNENSKICSAHFCHTDVEKTPKSIRIRDGAVPVILQSSDNGKKEAEVCDEKSKTDCTSENKKTEDDLVIEYDIPEPATAVPGDSKGKTQSSGKNGPSLGSFNEARKYHSCDECEYKTNYRTAYLRHKRTHTGEKPFGCSSCNYRTGDRTNLIAHMRRHTGEKPFSCDQCDYKASHRSTLLTHIRTHTGEKPYQCGVCDYKTDHHSHLITHNRTHTGEKPFACELCEYKTGHRPNYIAHLKTHSGIKSYACDICDFRSGQRSNLMRHKKSHTGENTFVCDSCDFKTDQRLNFITHLKTHTDKMPFVCPTCNFRTSLRSNLNRHMKTHTGEKPFKCDMCLYCTGRSADLDRHKKTHLAAIFQLGSLAHDALDSHVLPHLLTSGEDNILQQELVQTDSSMMNNHAASITDDLPQPL